jgi:6-pyruvoyltetrahydropterin/6-carboxytetrahydropterin synthase
MYKIKKTIEISAAHFLATSYPTPCNRLHGHNWRITVYCQASALNENGMVEDFSKVKHLISDKLDHQNLNEVLPFNPTAENMARWICEQIPSCYQVDVRESENNEASYEKD